MTADIDLLGHVVRYSDIDAVTFARNWSALSQNPDRMAAQYLADRMQHFAAVAAEFTPQITPDTEELLRTELKRHAEGYDRHFLAWASANGRTASSFVTGPSNFPTRRNEKRLQTVDRRYADWRAFSERSLARLRRELRRRAAAGIDPLEAAREKLASKEALQEEYKAVNKAARHKEPLAALMALGFSEQKAQALITRNEFGDVGVAPYLLINNRAEIRRLKARVAELERLAALAEQSETEETYGEIIFRQAPNLDRVQLEFPDKPAAEVIKLLKGRGFRYSHTNGAWQRQLTENGIRDARELAQQLQNLI